MWENEQIKTLTKLEIDPVPLNSKRRGKENSVVPWSTNNK